MLNGLRIKINVSAAAGIYDTYCVTFVKFGVLSTDSF